MANLTNLYDVSKCTACRGCQVACKDWNQLPASIEPFKGSYQTHADTNGDTFTIVKFFETEDPVDGVKWNFIKRQCMHCLDAACMKACPRGALTFGDRDELLQKAEDWAKHHHATWYAETYGEKNDAE